MLETNNKRGYSHSTPRFGIDFRKEDGMM